MTRFYLFVFSVLVFSSNARAEDIAPKHKEFCSTASAVETMGQGGKCRIFINRKDFSQVFGQCTATFKEKLPCVITYGALNPSLAAMELACGENPSEPVIKEEVGAEAVVYEVVAVIRKQNGKRVLITDPNSYMAFSSQLVSVYRSVDETTNTITSSAVIHLPEENVSLQNVVCK